MPALLFFKAKRPHAGDVMGDLFDMPVQVRGYTRKDGTSVPPHTEVRKVRHDPEAAVHAKAAEKHAADPGKGYGEHVAAARKEAERIGAWAGVHPRVIEMQQHIDRLKEHDRSRGNRAQALHDAITAGDMGAVARVFGSMASVKEASWAALDAGFSVPSAKTKDELLRHLQPQITAALKRGYAGKEDMDAPAALSTPDAGGVARAKHAETMPSPPRPHIFPAEAVPRTSARFVSAYKDRSDYEVTNQENGLSTRVRILDDGSARAPSAADIGLTEDHAIAVARVKHAETITPPPKRRGVGTPKPPSHAQAKRRES